MCYILGVYSPHQATGFTDIKRVAREQLLLRGRDAIGCTYGTAETRKSLKMVFSGTAPEKELANFLDQIPDSGFYLMLQTRAIPEPEISAQGEAGMVLDIQPFDNRGFVVSHNGTIANDQELRKSLDVPWQHESSVDSAILPYLFERDSVLTTVKDSIDGSFAMAVLDGNKNVFHLAKNFQPLYYHACDGKLCYSSLPSYITPTEFEPYTLLSFDTNLGILWYPLYRDMAKKGMLVSHSGGLDSTITLRLYQALGYEVHALFFKYGQQAESVEEHCSQAICLELNIPWHSVDMPMGFFKSPLLADEKPDLDVLEDAESTFSYVPQRNLIFAAYALGMAEQLELGGIALGMNLSDGGGYPDNGVPFLKKLGEITPYSSNWQTQLRVTAPFVNLMKSEMLQVGIRLGTPFKRICSCYYPTLSQDGFPIYCNDCGSDVHYRNAWGKLGFKPPNVGFESVQLPEPVLSDPDSTVRYFKLSDLPYGYVIKETL